MLFQLPSVESETNSFSHNKTNPIWNVSAEGSKKKEFTWDLTTTTKSKVYINFFFICFMYATTCWYVSGHDFHAQHFYMIHDVWVREMSKARELSLVFGEKLITFCRSWRERKWEYNIDYTMKTLCNKNLLLKTILTSCLWKIEVVFALSTPLPDC